jgi:type IV pilus assembly protein PilW
MSKFPTPRGKKTAGFTLIEVMVSMTIGLVVLAAVAGTFTVQLRQNSAEEQLAQMQQDVRGALDLMVREIEMAGFKSAGGVFNGVATSTATTLQIKLDLDYNGLADKATEDISYSYSSGVLTRTLNTPAVSSATLADNLTSFSFSYLDANGAATTTSTAVRRITINITAQTAKADPSYPTNGGKRTYQISADVTPPNLTL